MRIQVPKDYVTTPPVHHPLDDFHPQSSYHLGNLSQYNPKAIPAEPCTKFMPSRDFDVTIPV